MSTAALLLPSLDPPLAQAECSRRRAVGSHEACNFAPLIQRAKLRTDAVSCFSFFSVPLLELFSAPMRRDIGFRNGINIEKLIQNRDWISV